MGYKSSDFLQPREATSLWGKCLTIVFQKLCTDMLCLSPELNKCVLLPGLTEKMLTNQDEQR